MWGIAPKYLLAILGLLISAIVVALAWSLLSHVGFAVAMSCLGIGLFGLWLTGLVRSAWRQASQLDQVVPGFVSLPSTAAPSSSVAPNSSPRRGISTRSGTESGVSPRARTSPAPRSRALAGAAPGSRRWARSRQRDEEASLSPDATVSLAAERQAAGIDEVFTALDQQLIGLLPVKKKVEEIASLLLVDRVRQQFGLTAPRPNLHMCFTGEPGTGKTTMALQMGDLLHRLGYLEKGHVVHAMRDDLVGQFIGHTAPKTKRVLEQAMGGVLFIDEAYYLFRASDSKDYGQECIDILLQVMENDRDKLVVILAGYKDRMEDFFECNPGMSSRVAHHLDFAPYRLDELVAIGRAMLGEASYYLSDAAETAFHDYLTLQMDQPRFANARSVRNELEQARLRHAHRLAADPHRSWSKDDLMRIEPLDIFPNPAFAVPAPQDAAPQEAAPQEAARPEYEL
jgi:probable Rubsico expression protein CbbX